MALTRIEPFKVERWFDDHETWAKYNVAETCVASISAEELRGLSTEPQRPVVQLGTKLVYGPIQGSTALRSNVAALYTTEASSIPYENVLITAGGINANFLAFYTLLGRGDHVVCHHPTYQQLYSVPESLGAEVSLWKTRPEDGWQLHIDELKSLMRSNTKMIIINNPQNPTGAAISGRLLNEIKNVAQEHDVILFADEVYRPLFHSFGQDQGEDSGVPPSIVSLDYAKTVATGSMSKAFSLAGIRIGWIASRSRDIIEVCNAARDYTNISVSQIDDQIASYALSGHCLKGLLSRNIQLARANLAILSQFINTHKEICYWVKPVAGTTAFVKFSRDGHAIDDQLFCEELQRDTGVMLCPGHSCFSDNGEWKGYVRIGYACETEVLQEGLQKVQEFLKERFTSLELAA